MKANAVTAEVLLLGYALLASGDALAIENFKKLSGSQIRERFSGMEMTDEVHWRDYYERDGSFRSRGMGRTRFGGWSVQENELCVDLVPGTDSGCFEVWLSAKKVELRPTGLGLRLEGVLQKPTERN